MPGLGAHPPLRCFGPPKSWHNLMSDVVFALTGDVRRNSRALRQLRALSEYGLSIEIVSHGISNSGIGIPRATLHLIGKPAGRGPRYFWANHRKVLNVASAIQARVYHASDLYVLPALARTARRHGGSVIYDARELYPYVASTAGKPWVRTFWRLLEGRYIRQSDGVITVSDGIAHQLVRLYGIHPPVVVHNVPERPPFRLSNRLRNSIGVASDVTIILHQGQMRPHRGCEILVDVMQDVPGAALVFLGDGPLRNQLQQRARENDVAHCVFFLDAVPPDELLAYTASADVGVSLPEDITLNHHLALPNKLFEYLAACIPVVASDLPEIRKVVVDFDVGVVANANNRADLLAALRQATFDRILREKWRRNIPSVFETFNWSSASQKFLHLYDDVLESS